MREYDKAKLCFNYVKRRNYCDAEQNARTLR